MLGASYYGINKVSCLAQGFKWKINNINYDTIYNKALLFRNNVVKDELDKYLFFHKSIV